MPMSRKMMMAMLSFALPVPGALACPPPPDTVDAITGCTQPLTIVNRADNFTIIPRPAPSSMPTDRPAAFLKLPAQRLGSNVWLDGTIMESRHLSALLPEQEDGQ